MFEPSAIQHLELKRACARPVFKSEGLGVRFWACARGPAVGRWSATTLPAPTSSATACSSQCGLRAIGPGPRRPPENSITSRPSGSTSATCARTSSAAPTRAGAQVAQARIRSRSARAGSCTAGAQAPSL
eukprot:10465654-Alexandrium_andersonii.AAC.1